MSDDDQPLPFSVTESKSPVLPEGMDRVFPAQRMRIAERGAGLFEADPVICLVQAIFLRIPLELHPERVYLGGLTDRRFSRAARDTQVYQVRDYAASGRVGCKR